MSLTRHGRLATLGRLTRQGRQALLGRLSTYRRLPRERSLSLPTSPAGEEEMVNAVGAAAETARSSNLKFRTSS